MDDGPEPGQNTIAFCNVVAAEEVRMLVRYLVGQDWWHDSSATSASGRSNTGSWKLKRSGSNIRISVWVVANSRTRGSGLVNVGGRRTRS